MKKSSLYIITIFLFAIQIFAQKEGDVIINEIGNGGTKKALYNGGDYVELLVLNEEGIKLSGFYLTDLSSTGGTPKESEGYIKFSDSEGSIFNQVLPKGTYILICLGAPKSLFGAEVQKEIVDGKRIVVFTDETNKHVEKVEGTISLTGKDNIALVSSWNKNSAIDVVTWEGSSSWTGCEVTQLPIDMLENGEIVYFKPAKENYSNNTKAELWISTSDPKEATPGQINKDVDESVFGK
jgi:hypothetical protein